MDFFIKDENVRPGNRGGRDQFKWDDVRMMNNKDRESYLGVSQSIGFLDKGGKWRKRDWWHNFKPDTRVNQKKLQEERDKIKKEEEQMLMDALYGSNNPALNKKNDNTNKPLTDFQWEKIMKKKSSKVLEGKEIDKYEYYDDDKHRAGLGVKTQVSFRTNPYEVDKESLGRLKGINDGNENEVKQIESEIQRTQDREASIRERYNKEKNVFGKYIDDYFNSKINKKRKRSHHERKYKRSSSSTESRKSSSYRKEDNGHKHHKHKHEKHRDHHHHSSKRRK